MGSVRDAPLKELGYARYTTTTPAFALTATPAEGVALPAGTKAVALQAETADIRYRPDATNPTTTVGHLIKAGDAPFLLTARVQQLRFIQASAGAILHVTFYA
jgi:hypothetical protein